MGEKVTKMVLKVDLSCSKCRKKVKKVLCKFPQIQEQSFDEKTNTVTIKVVSCSPEEIRDKLCCKGEGVIKTIEILKPDEKRLKDNKKPPQQDGDNKKPDNKKPPQPDGENPKLPLVPVPCYPPVWVCWKQCSEGKGWGPCHQLGFGQGRHCDWCYARLVYESWGGSCHSRVYCRGRCSDFTYGRCSYCTCGRCSDCTCEGNPPPSCTIS
ncbi:Heavy metal transport/detoxification superfamily protein [Citrus sinensis]|uniref:Heavy metal transport/detoxification superfamily protein n=1 Tax=Citrus sinensis TaxID=2711 RepID=A0ACB8MW12_CITSI|nr:protein PYRICULARIA ORYZAE RESISTANCE 21-like isoform X2 [Citrus sinensis]XP_024047315.1 protein PYRICULARIA ORYZAE RESISTANCE 21 isoform X2 [Citrus x clementina]KAH9741149.1 Heavy metal transport/detoxification superfamily protein [Citrus sinensis]KAH9789643.1 Heavy metal transport/detoxification superfamily protein [Citrus sinensis]